LKKRKSVDSKRFTTPSARGEAILCDSRSVQLKETEKKRGTRRKGKAGWGGAKTSRPLSRDCLPGNHPDQG